MASKIKISDSPAQPKATFLRKSAFLTTGDSSFKFNFNVPQEHNDSTNVCDVIAKESTSQGNLDESKSNSETPKDITIKFTNSTSKFKFNFNIEK